MEFEKFQQFLKWAEEQHWFLEKTENGAWGIYYCYITPSGQFINMRCSKQE